MLASEFGCIREPFKLTPDPKFLYTSPDQLESYSRLFSGIHARKGLFLLTGEPGTGKTLLLRRMMDDLAVSGCTVFFFCNPVSSFNELLADCCDQAGLAGGDSRRAAFTEFIAKSAEIPVLLLDEAQAIPDKVLENLVQFAELENNDGPLLQMVLTGQPSLEAKLDSLGLESLVAGRAALRPLSEREVGPFVNHQLRAAGCNDSQLFSAEAITRVARYSNGLPGRINALCGSALLIASLESKSCVSAEMIDQAADDREFDRSSTASTSPPDTATGPSVMVEDPATDAPPTKTFAIDQRRGGRGLGIATALAVVLLGGAALYVINPPYEPVTRARNAVDDLVRMAVEAVSPGSAEDTTPIANEAARPSASPPQTDSAEVAQRAPESPPERSSSADDGVSPPEPGTEARPNEDSDIAPEPIAKSSPRPEASPQALTPADSAQSAAASESSPRIAVTQEPVPDPATDVAPATATPLKAEVPEASLETVSASEAEVPARPPAATIPTLTLSDVTGREDTPIPLDIAVEAPGDTDALVLRVRGVPRGATLSAGKRITGGWQLPPSDLKGLTVNPPKNSDQDFSLSLQLVDSTTETILENRTLEVTLNAVADPPTLRAYGANGDQFTAMPLQIRSWLSDKDGSETLTIKLTGLPPSSVLSAGRREADGTWSLSPRDLQGLILTPQEDTPPQIALEVTAVAVESSNNAMSTRSETITLGIVPAPVSQTEPEVNDRRDAPPSVVPRATRREPAPQFDPRKGDLRPGVLSNAERVARGEQLIKLGNFDGARRYLEQAAQSGDARAATALGKTYDPVFRTDDAQLGHPPDIEAALNWYTQAAEAGDAEARMRENALLDWLAR